MHCLSFDRHGLETVSRACLSGLRNGIIFLTRQSMKQVSVPTASGHGRGNNTAGACIPLAENGARRIRSLGDSSVTGKESIPDLGAMVGWDLTAGKGVVQHTPSLELVLACLFAN